MFANIALLLALSLTWASGYVLIARVDRVLSPITATAALLIIATLCLFIGVRIILRRPLMATLRQNPWPPIIMAATAVGLPQLSTVVAEDMITPDLATVIGTTVPILTFLVAMCVLKTVPMRLSSLVGVAIAVAGMIVFANPAKLLSQHAELQGIAIMVAGGIVFVVNGLYAANRTDKLDQYALTVWIMAFAAVGLTVVALSVEGVPKTFPTGKALVTIAAGGAIPIGLAYLLYYRLLAKAGASFTSLYAFLVPPLGIACTALFADGTLDLRHLVGVAIVLAGLWLVLRPGSNPT
ncbi:MAG: DMT family transporter [Rhodospirillaceae bacterium]|jgi:drug/metabolite transporter (DMT)-like permease|nr:DMT family transporter [Rhodospirillaceae bacterium]MBT3931075.1 DMT family transporter [Rhodospirillaceae bacterium]MBT4773935.1 DMT family transporter [Rhodospirillaceae bacterium]MBT5357502.1 DMT family transporter [Rhodospirillaceae bacterium]MBT5770491.1 DMT family transporter [Rhodospirillaceae bacterium]